MTYEEQKKWVLEQLGRLEKERPDFTMAEKLEAVRLGLEEKLREPCD